jgi:hypothetical protein
MCSSTALWIRVWVPTPATTMAKPASATQAIASGNQPLSAKPSVASAIRSELSSTSTVSCPPRWASHRPATTAPMPTPELRIASPDAPRPNTSAAKPGSSSKKGRALTARIACSSRIGPMPPCARV